MANNLLDEIHAEEAKMKLEQNKNDSNGQEKKEEQKPEDSGQSIKPDPAKEPKAEPKAEPKKEEKIGFDWDGFSKEVGRDFKSHAEIKDLVNKVSDYELRHKEFENTQKTLKEKEELFNKLNDPRSYFADEDEMKVQQVLKNIESKDQRKIVKRIFDSTDLDDFEKLKLSALYDNPNVKGGEQTVIKFLEKKYGVSDIPRDEWDDSVLFSMSSDAKKAFDPFARMLNEVKLPDKIDLDGIKKQKETESEQSDKEIKDLWEKFSPNIPSAFTEIKLQDEGQEEPYFVYKYDEEFKKQLPENVKAFAIKNKIPLNKENFDIIKELVENKYYIDNRHKINKAMIESERAKFIIERDKLEHNPKEPNRQEGDAKVEINPKEEEMRRFASKHGIKI